MGRAHNPALPSGGAQGASGARRVAGRHSPGRVPSDVTAPTTKPSEAPKPRRPDYRALCRRSVVPAFVATHARRAMKSLLRVALRWLANCDLSGMAPGGVEPPHADSKLPQSLSAGFGLAGSSSEPAISSTSSATGVRAVSSRAPCTPLASSYSTACSRARRRARRGFRIGREWSSLGSRADLRELRSGERGRLPLLPLLRGAARDCGARARAAKDGDGAVLRRDRLDRTGRVDGSGGAAGAAGAVLRADEGDRRGTRRHGREVHRRRGDGGLRRARAARGRRASRVPGGGRDARRLPRARDQRPDRRHHRRGRHRHRRAARDRRCGQRRRPPGAGRCSGRGADRRRDARARARRGRGGAGGAADAEGEGRAGSGVPADLGARRARPAASRRRWSAARRS